MMSEGYCIEPTNAVVFAASHRQRALEHYHDRF
jgi:hypothetical protein